MFPGRSYKIIVVKRKNVKRTWATAILSARSMIIGSE